MRLRQSLYILPVVAAALIWNLRAAAPQVTVYKVSTCGCCIQWVEHLRKNGFEVAVQEVPDVEPYKLKLGVPKDMESCHTAVVDGYTIEGHVPAADIQRLLSERPKAKGLAVPGMPMGSPGMEGSVKDAYNVMLFDESGKSTVFNKYAGD